MIQVTPHIKIYLCAETVNFRLGINGLFAFSKNKLLLDPFSGVMIVFLNKKKTSIKIFFYDEQGFCLYQKRLSKGQFEFWPIEKNDPTKILSPIHPSLLPSVIYSLKTKTDDQFKRWRSFEEHPYNSKEETLEDYFL